MTGTDVMSANERFMAPEAIRTRIQYAKALAAASMLPKDYRQQPANVLIAIETGTALGIPAVQALQGIAVINGKATLSADLMAAVVRRAGHKLRVEEDAEKLMVAATLIRSDDPDYAFKAVWNVAKAQNAGLWGTAMWNKYPLQMMRARAISEVVRQGASEVLFGCIYTPEEMGAQVNADGEVVDVEVVHEPVRAPEPQPQPQAQPEPAPAPAPTPAPEPQPAAAPEPEPEPEPTREPPAGKITEPQVGEIKRLYAVLEMDDYRLAKAVHWATNGRVNRVSAMSAAEAQTLIGEMLRQERANGHQDELIEAEVMEGTVEE